MKASLITYFILAFAFVFFAGLLLLLFSPMQFKKRFGRAYSRKQEFPFEMLYYRAQYLPLGRFLVILNGAAMFFASGMFLSTVSLSPSFLELAVFLVVFAGISCVFFILTWLVRSDVHVKLHLFSFVSFGLASAMMDFASLLAYFHFPDEFAGIKAVFIALLSSLAIIKVCILVNPKLKSWAKLDATMEEDGTITTSRPKIFILAWSEWILSFLQIGSSLLSLLGFFLLILPLI